ncbi:MAG: hypothetical protein WCT03_02380, partial [Candidatus Obscuribacterales bacterium]
ELWVYDLRANMPQFGKRTILTKEHFEEFRDAFGADATGGAKSLAERKDTGETGRFRCFKRDWLAERNDSLDISWLKDESEESLSDIPSPKTLADAAISELEMALAELQSLVSDLVGAENG